MNKLQALKTTIEKLESGEYEYSWISSSKCNCGLVAKTMLNGEDPLHYGEMFKYIDAKIDCDVSGFHGAYARTLSKCSTSGLPLPAVFAVLHEAGFTVDELQKLERCTHCMTDKPMLIAYLREWVERLELEQPKVKEVIRYVSVPSTITEQKLILS